MTRSRRAALLGAASLGLAACPRSTHSNVDPAPASAALHAPARIEIAQKIYDGGLVNDWQDWGWSPHELPSGQPARVRFQHWGGWILAKPGLTGDYGGLVLRIKTTEAEFLQVRVESNSGTIFPRVNVSPANHTDVGDGWSEVFVSMAQLDPDGLPFDRVVLHTFRDVGSAWVLIDKVSLTKASGGPPAAALVDPATLPQVPFSINCAAKATKINPMIYGMAYYAPDEPEKQQAQWLLDASARRWGGNTMSTYNYEVSAWNAGNDWFFENLDVSSYTYASFLKDNAAHGMASALTVPTMGWVAKDGTSSSFPVSVFGPQQGVDQWRQEAGNGKRKSGELIPPGPQSRAYVPITPAFVKKWVEAIRQEDAKTGKRSVQMYILDNEPVLWNTTHRDAHPEPLSYDELVQRTIDYGTAIREADPDAVIAGPAEWGWSGYLYSAKDLLAGVSSRPDRRAHGDLPLVAYYLRTLAEHEKATGVRVLDVLDLHGYPYADRVGGSAASAETAALRLRTTRMLWDPTYVDESWVKEPVRLLPRMREWVDQNYPGRGLSIGEWNFGGEDHISGGLATAEALGRFGQFGLTSAFYWVYPPANSPTMWAFRAYRNYDGKGARFLDWSEPTTTAPHLSLFASRDETGAHLVAVALNLSKTDAVAARVDVSSCGKIVSRQVYSYAGGGTGFVSLPPSKDAATSVISQSLAPYSMTVMDVRLTDAIPVAK